MEREMTGNRLITPGMTILDVLFRYREAQNVFKRYDEKAGVCLCCKALFDPLSKVSNQYGLDLEQLLEDLEAAILPEERPLEE